MVSQMVAGAVVDVAATSLAMSPVAVAAATPLVAAMLGSPAMAHGMAADHVAAAFEVEEEDTEQKNSKHGAMHGQLEEAAKNSDDDSRGGSKSTGGDPRVGSQQREKSHSLYKTIAQALEATGILHSADAGATALSVMQSLQQAAAGSSSEGNTKGEEGNSGS